MWGRPAAPQMQYKWGVAFECRNNWKIGNAKLEADPCHRRVFASYYWFVGGGSIDLSNSCLPTLALLKAQLVFKYKRVLQSLVPQFS